MLREADRWASVSADPRKLTGGGQYLAEVLGIWDDFQDGRPGLVSLWGTCTLAAYICEVDTRREPILTVSQRINLVCFFCIRLASLSANHQQGEQGGTRRLLPYVL